MVDQEVIRRFKKERRREKSDEKTNRLVYAFFGSFVMMELFSGRTDTGKQLQT